jgi:membrane protein
VLTTAVAAAGETLRSLGPALEAVTHGLVLAVSFAVVTVLFALIFKFLPDAEVRWRDVWVGAIATAALFVIGKFAIGFYLSHASIGSAYGAAGSFVVVLVWVYYSAQILLFGAELTQVYAKRRGGGVRPARNAVRITTEARAQQGRRDAAG